MLRLINLLNFINKIFVMFSLPLQINYVIFKTLQHQTEKHTIHPPRSGEDGALSLLLIPQQRVGTVTLFPPCSCLPG